MKSIKKITKAVAGSALLVGATLAGGAAMGAASSHGGSSGMDNGMMDLGDYPHPFVGEDGMVQSTVVVGADAKTVDVVGATNIAGQLGNDAVEEVAAGGSGSYGFSADGGTVLSTQNDQLYYGDSISAVRDTLTDEHLSMLAETTFRDDGGDETDVTNYLNLGNRQVTYGNQPDGIEDDEDPVLHVGVPSEGDVDDGTSSVDGVDRDNYLFNLQANFEDEIDFTSEDVAGEEIELFGNTYTVAEENFADTTGDDDPRDELLLYGSSQEVNLDSGQSTTVTVDGEEHTIELTGVTSEPEAVMMVDGERETVSEDESFTLGDTEVRVDDIFNYDAEEGTDSVTLSMGSQELLLQNNAAIEDGDGDEVEGTHVEFNGATDSPSENTAGDGEISAVSSIDVYVGAEDDDMDYVAAGDTWSHSAFPGVEFHFGGLNPNAAESDAATEVMVETNGDSEAQISFTSMSGESVNMDFLHTEVEDPADLAASNTALADSDNDMIATYEGQNLEQDDYFASDAGDFSHMWEVTNIDFDDSENEESTVELRDAVTGDTVEVELDVDDGDTGDSQARAKEIIDGQTYYFDYDNDAATDDASATGLEVTWGDDAGYEDTGGSGTGHTSVYSAVDAQNGVSVAFTESTGDNIADDAVVELPSTESTDEKTVDLSTLSIDADTATTGESEVVQVGQVRYLVQDGGDQDGSYSISVEAGQDVSDGTTGSGTAENPAAVVMQPENEGDDENAFVLTPDSYDSDDGYSFSGSDARVYTGSNINVQTMEGTDEDVDAGYNEYGTYVEQDTQDEGSVSLWVPSGQSVAGAAFTGADGSLSAGGSSGATSWQPTGWGDHAALDSDGNVADLKQNQNLILVGGPAVNDLTAELADGNKTWTGDQYSEGDAVLDLVHNAFSDGHHALVVAGYAGEDTRMAANYLADYTDHSEDLAGQTTLNVGTQ